MSAATESVLLTTAELNGRGLRPRTGEVPAAVEEWQCRSRSGTRHLWRLDQAVEVKVRTSATPRPASARAKAVANWEDYDDRRRSRSDGLQGRDCR